MKFKLVHELQDTLFIILVILRSLNEGQIFDITLL